ncbi:MAG: extracellular solute-binding protein [Candidatus Caldarchaeum sp.]|nr:extracellular solute-binding protein [Candidatus Caldarchaeum sp.]
MAASTAKTPLLLSVAALVVSIIVAGYATAITQSAQSIQGETSRAVKDMRTALDDVSGRISSLERLVALYAKASGIDSPQQAELIVKQREELQARVDAARRESGRLVVYGSVDYADIKSTLDAFQARYPFIQVVYESMRPPEVYTRVSSELSANKPTADLVLVSHPTGIRFAQEKRYLPYVSPEAASYPDFLRDKNGEWTAAVLLPIAFVYNTDKVKQPPSTLEALTDPQWSGKVIMHDVTLGTTGTQYLVSLKNIIGESRFNSFVDRLVKNVKPTLDISVSTVAEKVASGEFHIGLIVNLHDVVRLKMQGAPIEYFLPTDVPLLTTFSHIAIISTTKNPNSAKLLVDFILSKEGQTIIGNTPVRFPARPDTAARFSLDKIVPAGLRMVNYPDDEAIAKARDWAARFKEMGFGAK